MLQALLRGKLSLEQENWEDLLTSSVFGLLEYLPAESGLIPLLRLAEFGDGKAEEIFHTPGLKLTGIEFWPTYTFESSGSTEPDILIRAREPTGILHIVLIEVKLRSPKSSRPDPSQLNVVDQLAREWCVLVQLSKRELAIPHLFYITADRQYPHLEITESANEYSSKHPAWSCEFPFRCAWLSWLKIGGEFQENPEPALRDISQACWKLDLVPFRGFSPLTPASTAWAFAAVAKKFVFTTKTIQFRWSFQ